MRRLLEDESAPGSPEHYLASLIRTREPYRPDASRKRSVRAAIINRGDRRSTLLRPMLVAVAVLAAAASAAAALHHHRWSSEPHTTASPEPLRAMGVSPSPSPPPRLVPAPLTAAAASGELPEGPPASLLPEIAPLLPPVPSAMPSASASKPRSGVTAGKRAQSDDPATIVEAIRALRTDHDAVRAGDLLSRYMSTYPSGALFEDALALSIEAAVARHDPRAADYARRYLKQFPQGRFVKVARKALTSEGGR